MRNKGDIPGYILWIVILMIVVVFGLILFYLSGSSIIQKFLENKVFG
jgi:hypothetical protein